METLEHLDIFPLLVTGGCGRQARRTVPQLLARGVKPSQLIVTSRTPEKLSEYVAQGIDVRYADFTKPERLAEAFAGAKRMLLGGIVLGLAGPGESYTIGGTSVLKDPFSTRRELSVAIRAAAEAGVEHILYTSGLGCDPMPGVPEGQHPALWAYEHLVVEETLKKSGVTYTILRHGRQPDVFLTFMWAVGLDSGEYPDGYAGRRNAWITREDTSAADVGATLSATAEIANKTFNFTGPELLTNEDIMRILTDLTGKTIKVIPCEPEETGAEMVKRGAIPSMAVVYDMWAKCTSQGYFEVLTGDAARFAGRPLTTIRQYLAQSLPELPAMIEAGQARVKGYGVSVKR